MIVGGGIGAGLSTPGANPFAGWVDFETDGLYTFEAFDRTPVHFYSFNVGVLLFGYQHMKVEFPLLGTGKIDVGGFQMGSVGLDASDNFFAHWEFK